MTNPAAKNLGQNLFYRIGSLGLSQVIGFLGEDDDDDEARKLFIEQRKTNIDSDSEEKTRERKKIDGNRRNAFFDKKQNFLKEK